MAEIDESELVAAIPADWERPRAPIAKAMVQPLSEDELSSFEKNKIFISRLIKLERRVDDLEEKLKSQNR